MSKAFQVAGVNNLSFDIDFQGEHLYIAVKDEADDLHVLKQDAALENNAELVHSPSGSSLMVQCGRNSDRVWLAGSMGIIKYDGIAAQYWQDDSFTSSWNIETFHLGPDDDELILVFVDDGQVWESYFLQNYFTTEWFELNSGTGFNTFCVDRLDTSIDEWIVGANYFYNSGVMYTPNAAYNFEDVTGDLVGLVTTEATSVIFL